MNRNKIRFRKMLNEALKDEKKAPRDYLKMISATSNRREKTAIRHIANQERKHFRTLRKIKRGYI